jgi:hypothetical protein
MQQNIIYQGNSVISVETLPEYSHPVVIKKPSKRHPSQRSLRSLEKEYEMTRSLNAVKGVRMALGQQSIENQPALILEYIFNFLFEMNESQYIIVRANFENTQSRPATS